MDRFDAAMKEHERLKKIQLTQELEKANEKLRKSLPSEELMESPVEQKLRARGIPVKDVAQGEHL